MRVVCDACQAKYQIPDERVAGRKLKIRCRKCGGAIIVRGDHGTAEHAGPAPLASAAELEWHVSLEGEQHGPYPTEQMASMLRAGQVAWDAHVWHEGYAGWKTAGESDTLVRAVAAVSEEAPTLAAQAPSAPRGRTVTPMDSYPPGELNAIDVTDNTPTRALQSTPGLGQDALPRSARSSFAARSAVRQSQPPHVMSAARGAAAYQEAAPASFGEPRPIASATVLTGERNEDSVLFSARSLALSSSVAVAAPPRAGYASAEGSGLIDIRALAALAHTSQAATGAIRTNGNGNGRGEQDPLLALANQTGAFGNLDSLAPLDRASAAPNKALPIAIVAGSAMIAVAAVFAVYLLRPQTAPVPAQAVAVASPVQPVAPVPSAEPTPSERLAAQAEPEAKPSAAAAEPERAPAAVERPSAVKLGAQAKPSKLAVIAPTPARAARAISAKSAKGEQPKADKAELATVAAADSPKAAKKEAPSIDELLLDDKKPAAKADGPAALAATDAPAKPKDSGKGRSIDELLDDAVPVKKGAAEAASAALPEAPSRDQVLAAMHGVESAVLACAEGQTLDAPAATVAIGVTGSTGRVSSVRVNGVGGTVGSCIARAVRDASFPKFAKAQFSINFPFKLKK
jgi:predicted Zn finger-like uncharacterized protein